MSRNCPIHRQKTKGGGSGCIRLRGSSFFLLPGGHALAAGGCERSTTMRVKTAWKKFNEVLPILLSCYLSYKTRGSLYSSCFRHAMLHASETWPLTRPDLQRLRSNNRAIIRHIINVKPDDVATDISNKLLAQLEIDYCDVFMRENASLVWTC